MKALHWYVAALVAVFAAGMAPAQGQLDYEFTYQGRLKEDGHPANGTYDMYFNLYGEPDGTVWLDRYPDSGTAGVGVESGLFTVAIDFDDAEFDGEKLWLELVVEGTALAPKQELRPAPYAIYAARNWGVSGNAGTDPSSDFVGTTDSQALVFKVDNEVALRIEPPGGARTCNSPPLVWWAWNESTPAWPGGACGTTISGGGSAGDPNKTYDDFCTVGGGAGNEAGSDDADETTASYATVAGGRGNNASGEDSAVGGGQYNTASADESTVGGGYGNGAAGQYSTIGGGFDNEATAENATIGGGFENWAFGASATIGGGEGNHASDQHTTIAGGAGNLASAMMVAICGGESNVATGSHATIGGGWHNNAQAPYATIAGGGSSDPGDPGGTNNRVTDEYGTVGGGGNNQAGDNAGTTDDAVYATVAGGEENTASANYATVGGGHANIVSGSRSTIGGGGENQASGSGATVGGGDWNVASGTRATVPGGRSNVAAGLCSFAAGRVAQANHDGTFVWADSDIAAFASTGQDQFLIQASGGVGINTNAPAGFDLAVNGTAAKPGGGAWSVFSDARLKKNVEPLKGALERLLALRGVAFEYKDPAFKLGLPGRQIGLIAQEVEQVFPSWVDEDPDGYKYVTVRGLEALVVEALRELRQEKDAELESLRAENAEMRSLVSQLSERLDRLERAPQ